MTAVVSLDNMLASLENAGVSAFGVIIENGQFFIRHRSTAYLTFLQHYANVFSEPDLLQAIENSIRQSHHEDPVSVYGQFSRNQTEIYWTCQLSRVRTVLEEHLLYLPDTERQEQFLCIVTWNTAEHDLSEHFFRSIVENSPDVMIRVDTALKIVYINRAVERYTGIRAERFIGRTFEQLDEVPRSLAKAWNQAYQQVIRTGAPIDREFDFPAPFGTVSFLSHVLPEIDTEGKICTLLTISRDISDQKKMQRELAYLASTDPLTGTYNRRYFLDKGQQELQRARRYLVPFTLLLVDIDNFKQINDIWGHAFGDEVLQKVSAILDEEVRETDIIGRLGGDEFCVLLVNTRTPAAQQIALRVLNRVREITRPSEAPLEVGVSIGVAEWDINDETLTCLIKRADARMYRAKHLGKGQVFIDDPP